MIIMSVSIVNKLVLIDENVFYEENAEFLGDYYQIESMINDLYNKMNEKEAIK